MTQQPVIKKFYDWFNSGDAYALIRSYHHYHEQGTTGVNAHIEPKNNMVNERGVLRPERFEQYMLALESVVRTAKFVSTPLPQVDDGLDFRFLMDTLQQMGNTDLPEAEVEGSKKNVAELFKQGREMGDAMQQYFAERNRQGGGQSLG